MQSSLALPPDERQPLQAAAQGADNDLLLRLRKVRALEHALGRFQQNLGEPCPWRALERVHVVDRTAQSVLHQQGVGAVLRAEMLSKDSAITFVVFNARPPEGFRDLLRLAHLLPRVPSPDQFASREGGRVLARPAWP